MADDAAAADIICSLRGADLGGWTPPWVSTSTVTGEAGVARGELSWPAVARGKRSRSRRSGVAGRCSPASPLDCSGGSGSGASTSGGEDGAFCSPWHRRAFTSPAATKVGSTGRLQLTFQAPPPRATVQRQRRKMSLPEVQQSVRLLAAEKESLHEEMMALRRACQALAKENHRLETRVDHQSSSQVEKLKGVQQSTQGSLVLPDLNLPAQDTLLMEIHST